MEIGKEMQLVCGDTQVRIYDCVYLHTTIRVNPHEVDVKAWDMHARKTND